MLPFLPFITSSQVAAPVTTGHATSAVVSEGVTFISSVSMLLAPNEIVEILKTQGIATNNHTISDYLDYTCRGFMLYEIKRYDVRGQKYLQSLHKYYF